MFILILLNLFDVTTKTKKTFTADEEGLLRGCFLPLYGEES
tara:strand:+ start:51 stop:173 length:123 start_codon:yes stop_codon:yes gene_type:complete